MFKYVINVCSKHKMYYYIAGACVVQRKYYLVNTERGLKNVTML